MKLLTTSKLRKQNKLQILKVIKKHSVISRPELANKTKLTNATVCTLIDELLKNNIVTEEGYADSIGGRKAMLYRFNESAYYIIGINMQINIMTVDLFDLGANKILKGLPVHLKEGQSVEHTIHKLIKNTQELIADSKKNAREIIGIAITVPGCVDCKKGVISYLPNLKNWVNIPLKEIVENETGISTYIERDTNSHISYLKWLDVIERDTDVVYCVIGEGIGAAVLINGQVYHGAHGLAGEIGHTTLDPDGPRCNCGNYGCVEELTYYKAILSYYAEELDWQEDGAGIIKGMRMGQEDSELIDKLARLALDGNAAADKAFTKASRYVSALISNIINTYNPSLIIVECRWMKAAKKYFNEIVSKVYDSSRMLNRNSIKIMLNPIDDIFRLASPTIVLEQLFLDIDNNRFID